MNYQVNWFIKINVNAGVFFFFFNTTVSVIDQFWLISRRVIDWFWLISFNGNRRDDMTYFFSF